MADPEAPKEHKLRLVPSHCPDCATQLYRLDPPVSEWRLWCPKCQALTSTYEERQQARANMPEGALGFVTSVTYPMDVELPSGS